MITRRSKGALHAFIDTDLDLYINGGEGWRNYAALGAQISNTPEWGAEMFDRHFDPVVLRLIGILKRAMPDCSESDVFWGLPLRQWGVGPNSSSDRGVSITSREVFAFRRISRPRRSGWPASWRLVLSTFAAVRLR